MSAKIEIPKNPSAPFWSLFAINGKEKYFNKLKNTSIKTFDKNFTLDIFDTDDNDISIFQKGAKNSLAQLLDKYFIYIHGKGIHGTFIPSLVGVFKIKINDFKTLLVLVTRNSLVENIPKNHFSYWHFYEFYKANPKKYLRPSLIRLLLLLKMKPYLIERFKTKVLKIIQIIIKLPLKILMISKV